jgi:hypothetical protein
VADRVNVIIYLVLENLVLRASPRSRLAGVRVEWICRKAWSLVLEYWSIEVSEIPNHKYQTNPKFQTCFGYWVLEFEICL